MNNTPVSKLLLVFISLLSLILGFLGGAIGYLYMTYPMSDEKNPPILTPSIPGQPGDDIDQPPITPPGPSTVSGELQIHFMELGNKYSGDSILIQVGEYDILVDAGSKRSSYDTIKNYLDTHLEDDTLEYVIVTHAHEDHYANFAGNGTTSLLTDYTITNLIQFSKTNQTTGVMYNNYLAMVDKIEQSGTKVCNALESYNNENGCSRIIDLGFDTEIEILYQKFYENKASSENDYSVCFLINQGSNHFLFTGDLEEDGEESLVEENTLPQVSLFKAGHHGSNTSSHDVLLDVIQPEIVVITAVVGNFEYAKNEPGNVNINGTFPTTATLTRIAKHTSKVYATSLGLISQNQDGTYEDTGFESLNGDIVVTSNSSGITVTGSNNNTLLKDTVWAQTYRSGIVWND